ncbi:MAG TPA: dihydrofolate reductase family protein [Thermomicrobiales bacterium]|jgi:dihydrofolate reductase
MGRVVAEMSMSLDGFIADPAAGVGELFGWYTNGPVTVAMPGSAHTFRVSEASAGHLREGLARIGSLVTGRRTFDIAEGFGGSHPYGVPLFVVTHTVPAGWPRDDAPFTFVTEGVERAVEQAKAVAGERCVGVGAADVVRQCLDAGLLDEIVFNLVPVLLGKGIRFFDQLATAPITLDTPAWSKGPA